MSKKVYAAIAIGGGVTTIAGIWWFARKNNEVVDQVTKAVAKGGSFNAHLTGYWPYTEGLTAKERLMEGGQKDRKGNPLHTLEMHLADPVAHPFCSVAGDYNIFPYGQLLRISAWPGVPFRVVDTGGHFHGINKVYRVFGEEPLDICVASSKTVVPKKNVVAQIVTGDNFEKGKAVATKGFTGQEVSAGVIEGRTKQDYEALARAVESELGKHSTAEKLAGAWAIKNRADVLGVSVADMLAPNGVYGPTPTSSGYASTRKLPSGEAREIAICVLDGRNDPTDGATEFWIPEQQDKLHQLGEVYRAAKASNDTERMRKYERFEPFTSEMSVRSQHASNGYEVLGLVGSVELLKHRG